MPLVVVVFLGLYWLELLSAQRTLVETTTQKSQLRAERTASAVALQVATMMRGLDFVLQNMANDYASRGIAGLEVSINNAQAAYPDGTFLQLAVADVNGNVLYSNMGFKGRLSVADRPYFRAHLGTSNARLFIDRPAMGRISHQWSLHFSRPVFRHGQLAGVVIAAVTPQYLADQFRQVAAGPHDVILLLRSDGAYLARSARMEDFIGKRVPSSRPFLTNPQLNSGSYRATVDIDHIPRTYGWQRVNGLPLVLSVGLDLQDALHAERLAINHAVWRSLITSAVILAASLLIAWLLYRQEKERHTLRTVYQLVPMGVLLTDSDGRVSSGNASAAQLLGVADFHHQPLAELLQHYRPVHRDHTPHSTDWLAATRHEAHVSIELENLGSAGPRWLALSLACADDPRQGQVVTLTDISAQHDARAQLAESEERLSLALRGGELGLWDWDIPSGRLDVDTRWASMLGRQVQDIQPHINTWRALMHPDDLPRVERRLQEHLAGHSAHYECEYRMARPDGRWSWILAHGQVMRHGDDGSPQRALGTHMDITTRKTADEERRAWQIRLEKLTSQIPGVVYQLRLRPDGRIGLPYVSPGMYAHYGVRPEQVAQDAGELFDLIHPDDRRRLVESLYQSSRNMKVWETEWRILRPDGQWRWVLTHAKPERENDGSTLWNGYTTDITERKQGEEQLKQLATSDALTGLNNRRNFYELANAELARVKRYGGPPGALVMLDLDHFKRVNDDYGHAMGDHVLHHVSHLIRDELRIGDIAGRLGGEEFAILLVQASLSGALQFAERLRARLASSPIATDHAPIIMTSSFGVTALQTEDAQIDVALARADQALYQAKERGRNRVESQPSVHHQLA
ncbi:MAG TPA: diguanylate cyclase [Chromobacteriaceae bacterium]|nr:diguanylate cyclase [Chromobacteriaceae bacterium]